MDTYREKLCNKDEKGNTMFSPLCQPGALTEFLNKQEVSSEGTQGTQGTGSYGKSNCFVNKVPRFDVSSHVMSDAASANDWFRDPTYSEQISFRALNGPWSTKETSESQKMYHDIKTKEKIAGALYQTL